MSEDLFKRMAREDDEFDMEHGELHDDLDDGYEEDDEEEEDALNVPPHAAGDHVLDAGLAEGNAEGDINNNNNNNNNVDPAAALLPPPPPPPPPPPASQGDLVGTTTMHAFMHSFNSFIHSFTHSFFLTVRILIMIRSCT